jgi:two-component system response regulator FlrC
MPEVTGQELLAQIQKREIGTPFIMITAHGTVTQAVEAMQLGAADFIGKPFSSEELLRIVERVLSPESREFRTKNKKQRKGRPIITTDPVMIRVLEVAEAVARSDATVLIQGESGTGKELVARLLHASSPRAQQAFVAVNCAALPENLLESELFGHEKGAFTGAQQRKIGKFELAHGGTILLDEVSEMALPLQAKLLRVLQEREVDRVGGRDPISIDVRVLATTNRHMDEMVAQGLFRADLFYRLNVIPLTLPALRERPGDVKLLIEHFMRIYLGNDAPALSREVLTALQGYEWPGNIRELQNAVERAAILCRGRSPQESDFLLAPRRAGSGMPVQNLRPEVIVEGSRFAPPSPHPPADGIVIRSGTTVADMERALILETLKNTDNNRTQAAKLLGISIRTLRNKLHEYRMAGVDLGGVDAASDGDQPIDEHTN